MRTRKTGDKRDPLSFSRPLGVLSAIRKLRQVHAVNFGWPVIRTDALSASRSERKGLVTTALERTRLLLAQ